MSTDASLKYVLHGYTAIECNGNAGVSYTKSVNIPNSIVIGAREASNTEGRLLSFEINVSNINKISITYKMQILSGTAIFVDIVYSYIKKLL